MFELLFSAPPLFLIFVFTLIPIGSLVSKELNLAQGINKELAVLLHISLSIIIIFGISSFFIFFDFDKYLGDFLLLLFSICFALWFKFCSKWNKQIIKVFGIVFLYYMLCAGTVNFPNLHLRNSSPSNTMNLTGLPVDLLIPYNASRFFINNIQPLDQDIVGGWHLTDRGPVSGVFTTAYLSLFKRSESNHWNLVNNVNFYIYQCLFIFLNSLALLAALLAGLSYGKFNGVLKSSLIIASSSYFFINTFFAWPKFLMAFLVFSGVLLHLNRVNKIIIGMIMGVAILTHDSAMFAVSAFYLYFGLTSLFGDFKLEKLKNCIITGLVSFCLITPWFYIKSFLYPPSRRGLYYHLFCSREVENLSKSFKEMFVLYNQQHSIVDIITLKLQSILYPFSFLNSFKIVFNNLDSPILLYSKSVGEYFFVFFPTIGVLCSIALIVSIYRNRKNSDLMHITFTCLGAVIFAALTAGCKNSTINHVWAAQAFPCVILLSGFCLTRKNLLIDILVYISVGVNIFFSYFVLYHKGVMMPFMHASQAYVYYQITLTSLFVGLIFFSIKDYEQE